MSKKKKENLLKFERKWCIIFLFPYGGVRVSTGILRSDKRVEPGNSLNGPNLKLNANDNVALAA